METDDQIPDKDGHDDELDIAVLSSGDGTNVTLSVPPESNRTHPSMDTSLSGNTNSQSAGNIAVNTKLEGQLSEVKTAEEFDKQLEHHLSEVKAAADFDKQLEGQFPKVKVAESLQSDDVTDKVKIDSSNSDISLIGTLQSTSCDEIVLRNTDVDNISSMDTKDLTPQLPKCDDLTIMTLESDGEDLLTELDRELASKELDADNTTCGNISSEHADHSFKLSDNMKNSTDLASLPVYKEVKKQNEELIKEQEKMKLEIERLNKAVKESNMKLSASETDIYVAKIKKLELTISNQQTELEQTKHRLELHDTSAKKAVAALQNELRLQVDKAKRIEEEAGKEKERMTIKYAQSEQKNIKLQQSHSRLELQIKDMLREREVMIGRFKVIKAEKQKLQEQYDAKVAEVSSLKKELEKEKEAKLTLDVKLKWHQNKLKTEYDKNKELMLKIEDLQRKLKEAKEETEVMRHDYHEMIKTYQESDEIRSNSLEKQVKVKDEELQQHLQEKTDQEEVHTAVVKELDVLKKKHRDAIEELRTLKDKVTCLEAERITQEHTMDKFKETLQSQKYENKQLNDKLAQFDAVSKELISAESRIKQLEAELAELQDVNKELLIDMEGCSKRESEHLIFSQKISDKNAQLQSENNSLTHKLHAVMQEQQRLASLCELLEEKVVKLEKELMEEKRLRKEDVQSLTSSLESKSRAVEELSRTIEEEKDENRTLKRKHNAYTKDLLRQLHQTRKRLEQYEQNHVPSERDSLSVGSRTSSTGSLDTLGNSGNLGTNQSGNSAMSSAAVSCHNAITHQEEEPPIVEVVEVDKQMLLDKIVRLQKAHARKNEKIEFMEDHINQLVADIQKKTRIIQHYLLLEETGSLSPEFMDKHKAQLAKKGGIMASLYNSQSQDGTMSLELSLEINNKLQAVLEDTILKNMTYKDNLMTLGEEISHLSQENRRLQLQAMKQPTS